MLNVKIVLHRIIFCSTYRQNTHSQRRPKQPTMTSGSGSSWAWSRMGLLSSRELGLLPLMIAPCCVHRDATRREATTFRVVGYGVFFIKSNEKRKIYSSCSIRFVLILDDNMILRANVSVGSNGRISLRYDLLFTGLISCCLLHLFYYEANGQMRIWHLSK
jgi:hypothetical protein